MKTFLSLLGIACLIIACQPELKKKSIKSPIEVSNYKKLTSNSMINGYLQQVSEQSEFIDFKIIDSTKQGKKIHLVEIKSGSENENKINLFLFAQQHGNEPSGKEGLLMLINEFAKGNLVEYLSHVNLIILPQTNPDGGDKNLRRNADDIDPNRDHLLLRSKEASVIQRVSNQYKPEAVVDLHEYYPYSEGWTNFGYLRNFDIQFGGCTNINIDSAIRTFFYTTAFPEVKKQVDEDGYSFFEYTLGYLPEGERLRHSTVDINDGRQSHGITNTVAFIIEGKRGRDSLHLLERRAKSQLSTCIGILKMCSKHSAEIKTMVNNAQNQLLTESTLPVSIRLDHFKGSEPLEFPLLSLKTNKDTTFIVEEFHSEIKSLLDVKPPKGYLIPKKDTLLCNWLKRSFFKFEDFKNSENQIWQYTISKLERSVDEELENWYAKVELKKLDEPINQTGYYFVPVNQIYKYKIVTALEPQAMYGLVNYPEFEYLLKSDSYPILRIE